MSSKSGNASPPNVWVRVVRTGNTLSGYKSVDGINWTLVNSANIAMASNIYIGLAEASGSASTLATSLFTNVMVVP
jgi:regulation of enolase protein 1 (concanavalin A-like superfamily)